MRDDDAHVAAHLLRAAYGNPDGGTSATAGGPNLPLTASRVRRWRQSSAAAWIAEVPAYGPVGVVFAVIEPGAAWMAGLGVLPTFRGAGVGAALTDRALEVLAAAGRPVSGMEAAPTSVSAAGLYARRGFRPADLTVRVRGVAEELGAPADLNGWRVVTCSEVGHRDCGHAAEIGARVHSQPHSPAGYLLIGPDAALLCDPDPLLPAARGSLDLRLVMASDVQVHQIEHSVRAAARSASLRGLALLEIDLALADGVLLRRLLRLGMEPVASTIRLVDDPVAYAAWRQSNGPIGRWSF